MAVRNIKEVSEHIVAAHDRPLQEALGAAQESIRYSDRMTTAGRKLGATSLTDVITSMRECKTCAAILKDGIGAS